MNEWINEWMNGVLGHICQDGEMNEMTLPSRHHIQNLSPGGLMPSTLPLGHGGSPQYWFFYKWAFVSLKPECQSGGRTRHLQHSKQTALTTAPGPHIQLWCCMPPTDCMQDAGLPPLFTWDISTISGTYRQSPEKFTVKIIIGKAYMFRIHVLTKSGHWDIIWRRKGSAIFTYHCGTWHTGILLRSFYQTNLLTVSLCGDSLSKYPGPVFSYKLRDLAGFGLVEMVISTNTKPTIYRNVYEDTGPDQLLISIGVRSYIGNTS